MSKTSWWIFIVIVLIVVGVWVWRSGVEEPIAPADTEELEVVLEEVVEEIPEVAGDDTTSAITEELEGIDLGDLEREFQEIDKELENL